jgi:hypothetical protein
VFCITQIFGVFTQSAPVVNFSGDVVALFTVMHALAERIELQEPFAKVQPSAGFVERSQFVISTVSVVVTTVLVAPSIFGQCRATNVAASLECR